VLPACRGYISQKQMDMQRLPHDRVHEMAAAVALFSSTTTGLQMQDERYSNSSWDYADNSTADSPTTSQASHSQQYFTRPSHSRESPNSDTTNPTSVPTKSVSPDGRSSLDSATRQVAPPSKWRESLSNGRDTASTIGGETMSVVEHTFDENVLRALCDMDVRSPRQLFVL
jgi:hypothetical protein